MKATVCALLLALLLPGLALAQDAKPPFEEGRPARLRLTLVPSAEHPVALLRLEGAVGAKPQPSWEGGTKPTRSRSEEARRVRGVSLAPHLPGEVVTLDLVASEDLSHSAVARAPLPDAHANLEGEAYVLCRLLAPGEAVNVTVSFVPTVDRQYSLLAWRGVGLNPSSSGGQVFARGPGHSWTPGAERASGPDLEGPPKLPGPGLGEGPRTSLRVHLTRWTPWKGEKRAREVLLSERALLTLEGAGGENRNLLTIKPAAFGLAKARAKAKVSGEAEAVRLEDDRWVLGQRGRWWIVDAKRDVALGAGEVFPFALDLAREGRAGFLWYGYGDHPKLARDLQERGFSPKAGGKALAVEVTPKGLVTFLELLDAHGVRLARSGIERKE